MLARKTLQYHNENPGRFCKRLTVAKYQNWSFSWFWAIWYKYTKSTTHFVMQQSFELLNPRKRTSCSKACRAPSYPVSKHNIRPTWNRVRCDRKEDTRSWLHFSFNAIENVSFRVQLRRWSKAAKIKDIGSAFCIRTSTLEPNCERQTPGSKALWDCFVYLRSLQKIKSCRIRTNAFAQAQRVFARFLTQGK